MSDPLISLSLGLGDILPTIVPPVDDGPSITNTPDPTITVTVTVPNPSSSSSSSSSSLISNSSTHSHSGVSTNNATLPLTTPQNLATTNTADFITTTYLTYQGTALVTITALVQNPARMQDNVGTNTFFSNRTAVIGVFTAVGIIIFAAIVALLAWAARKRKLKRLRREAAEKASSSGHRNFFDDEVNDVVAPSEKSWWGNTSGTSIPDPTLPMLHANTGYNNAPAVPPLPEDISATSPLSDIPTSIAHPYASAPPSIISDSYQVGGVTHARDNSTTTVTTTTTTPSRDFSRSPPPSVPLPGVANRFGQGGAHLPQIDEVTASSSNAWVSNGAVIASEGHSSKGGPVHPYASPPTNRKSTLYPEDVLFSLGKDGGMGRSLSGRMLSGPDRQTIQPQESVLGITQGMNMMHQNNMPQPASSLPPVLQVQVQRPAEEPISRNLEIHAARGHQNSQARTAPVHEHHSEYGINDRPRSLDERPVSGILDGGWYEHEVSDTGRAAASGESILGGSAAHNTDYGYPRIGSTSDMNVSMGGDGTQGSHRAAASSPAGTDVRDPKNKLHDPRFSGLFGSGWISSGDESRLGSNHNHGTRLSSARGSFDHGTADDHYYDSRYGSNGNRVLRVTNE